MSQFPIVIYPVDSIRPLNNLAWVVRKMDNAIHCRNHYPAWFVCTACIAWFVLLPLIRWIAIYPVDSVIQPSNNWGLANNESVDIFRQFWASVILLAFV